MTAGRLRRAEAIGRIIRAARFLGRVDPRASDAEALELLADRLEGGQVRLVDEDQP